MLPVLSTIGTVPISSFGFFLLLALLTGAYFIWRVIRVYDFNEEKVIDLILLTFLGGLIGARAYFVLTHLSFFDNLFKIVSINRYPGLSFWGALVGGILSLAYFSKKFKLSFWQVADYAVVGVFIGLSIGSLGCLLGACGFGQISSLPIAVPQVGLIGNRFPIQVLESLLFFLGFLILWRKVLKFHAVGQIAAKGIILLGVIKFLLEFLRGEGQFILGNIRLGTVYSLLVLAFGLTVSYRINKKSPKDDLYLALNILKSHNRRKAFIGKLNKSWYNLWVNLRVGLTRWRKRLFRSINVKSNPDNF